MPWGILQWTCICFKGKSSKIVITPFAENSLQGHPFILFFFQFCQNLFFSFLFFFSCGHSSDLSALEILSH